MRMYLTEQEPNLPLHVKLHGLAVGANPRQDVTPFAIQRLRSSIPMRTHFHKPIGTWLRLTLIK